MGESMCIEGATDAAAFEVYIEHFLAPSLTEGQVVVMDNLGAHQPKRIRELSSKPEELSWCTCPPTLRI
jgi:transposase